MKNFDPQNYKVAVIGLGYVGMPLAVRLAHNFKTVGFDISTERVTALRDGWDSNREIKQATLRTKTCLFTNQLEDISDCNIYIITVPTPVDSNNTPDLGPLEAATKSIAPFIQKNDIIIYESTVYPGITENYCGSLLEKKSGLVCGKDFFLGYSPERINPGDKEHTVENITKVVAGQTPEVSEILYNLYALVTGGKVFKARNIMTAEASKAIENAQRDINVAFVNEITIILNKMGLSAHEVLEAAKTKWNFLPFTPGLVGGHCISVDPYYLAQCAQKIGHEPEVILSGRKINDNMGEYVGKLVHESLLEAKSGPRKKILVLGFTFKENINDTRNTKVIDVIDTLKTHGHDIEIHDPHAQKEEVRKEYGIDLVSSLNSTSKYDAIALLVPHQIYKDMSTTSIESILNDQALVFDMKGIWKNQPFSPRVIYKTL